MFNLVDDNELDRLSKEASGKFHPPGKPNWQALQAELDKVLPEKKTKRKFFFFWWLIPALLLGISAWWWYPQERSLAVAEKNSKSKSSLSFENKQPVNKPELIERSQELRKMDHPEKNTISRHTADETVSLIQKEPAKKKLLQKDNTLNVSAIPDHLKLPITESAKKDVTVSPAVINPNVSKPNELSNPALLSHNPVRKEKNEKPVQTADNLITASTEVSKESDVAENKNTGNPLPELIPLPGVTERPTGFFDKKISYPPAGKGWSISLVAGADKSTVKFRYGNDPGINIGVIAGYHLNNRWSLHTGALFTQKNYKLAGEDFTAPKGSWLTYTKLENVEGYCRMWEVPVMIRYHFNAKGNKTFFAGAGLSSYFMTSENYNYFYYANGIPTTRGATYPSTDTHILSIGHLSAGFENRLTKKMYLLIEPYAKIPFDGLGLGNIRLSSFGINFSVQYRQPGK